MKAVAIFFIVCISSSYAYVDFGEDESEAKTQGEVYILAIINYYYRLNRKKLTMYILLPTADSEIYLLTINNVLIIKLASRPLSSSAYT